MAILNPAGQAGQAGQTGQTDRLRKRPLLAHPGWQLFGIWLFLRLLTSIWAALASPIYPVLQREHTIALWPPSFPLHEWLMRVFVDPWGRWDARRYMSIVEHGYQADNGSTQFHPLLSWLAMPINWLTGSPLLSLLLVSSLASLLLLFAFERLARFDMDPAPARTATLLLIFSPIAFVLFAPYTEGLFLLGAVLCFLWARQGSWWLAALAGALATLTRQQGLFLLLPLAWELWEASGRNWRQALADWKNWLSLALIPGAMLLWIIYRAIALQDVNPDTSSFHSLIYTVLISPSSSQVVPNQSFMFPLYAFWQALTTFWSNPQIYLAIDLVLGIGFLALLLVAWPRMRTSYRIYTLIIVLVSFSYNTGLNNPYMGLPRHLLLAFPIFIGLAPRLHSHRVRLLIVASGLLLLLFMLPQYVLESWVP
jgi:Gpi18-like mannosyltransferase